ncbi:membrane protein [[Actinobacillus] muris]|uniref:Membrane protein n=1 Tax=Muribacter muris TaxID=67855 RepID=A0A0J5S1R7_9PAST|nr:phosphoethanolamine transferase [Muribacter muris]KMK50762.1 membrane protein [[Actinobacillus] muris] [Muribacter muris]
MSIFAFIPPLASLGLAAFGSFLMLLGSGFFPSPTAQEIALLTLVWLLLNSSKKAFYALLLPIVSLYALYTPIGLTFGAPSYQYVASVFATDLQESREFFRQIPPLHYLAMVGIFACLLLFRYLTERFRVRFHHNRTFLVAAILLVFISTPPFKFLYESYSASRQVSQELSRLNGLTIDSAWGQARLIGDQYDDYVLVIGESARKDYHHAYGYPSPNTPFMSSANGTLIDGLTAGGTNTIASLKVMLTLPDTLNWEGDYTHSLIDLVKSAGIKTVWLSNQGYLGTFDTPVSALANKSDETIFLKSGDSFSQNISDFALLPIFRQIITQPSKQKRFIVVHLYGSHPISCDRLTDYPKLYDDATLPKKYHNLNCYVSSIKKTDELLATLHQYLTKNYQQNQRRFSMVYFADHGLAHSISEDNIVIHNSSGKSPRHFDVPLFKIASDDHERKVYQAVKSGLNFTNGIANWLGIEHPKLDKSLDLFSPQSHPDDYGLKGIIGNFNTLPDPAIPIPTP